jgi:RNA polymerase-binding transcription factor
VHPEDGLAAQRADLVAQAADLRADLDGIVAAARGANADDEHDPEGATIAFERAQTAALLERTEARIADLDRALDRLAAGSYGICARCGRPIGAERLAARPDATTCVRCAASR